MTQRKTKLRTKTAIPTVKRKPKPTATRDAAPKTVSRIPAGPGRVDQGQVLSGTAPETIVRPKGKLGTLLTLIEAEGGATLEDLSTALTWQPHSTRAAITGLRKRGFEIALVTEDGHKAYRIAA